MYYVLHRGLTLAFELSGIISPRVRLLVFLLPMALDIALHGDIGTTEGLADRLST